MHFNRIIVVLATCAVLFSSAKASAQTFSYDSGGHVIKASYVDGVVITHKYDAAGNLKKSRVVTAVMASISVGKPSGGVMRYTVQRTGDLSRALTINLLSTGDAISGKDYSGLPSSVTFLARESSVSFCVRVISDQAEALARRLVVSLTTGDDYNLAEQSSATIILPGVK